MVRMGLIGVGKMGRYHLNLYDEITDVSLSAVCDSNKETLRTLAETKAVPGFENFRDIFPLVDAVTVATPTVFHYEIVRACLKAGKHTLVEKPITTDYCQAEELFELAEKNNLILHIGYVERFNPAVRKLKGIIGNPRLIEARRAGPFNPNFKNDSVVMDIMIHDIDIVAAIAGGPVVAIQAMGAPVYTKLADYASVNIHFNNSIAAHVIASRISPTKERFLNVTQDDKLIALNYASQEISVIGEGRSPRLLIEKGNPLKAEIKHFISCVEGKSGRMVSIEDELLSLRVALEIDTLIKSDMYGCKELIW